MFPMRINALLLMVATGACAPASSSSEAASTPTPAGQSGDVITAAELSNPDVRSGDALAAVRRLRPRFLVYRGSGSVQAASAGSTHVSIDGGPLSGLDALARLRAIDVGEIRFLSAPAAAQRFGTAAATGPVLLVKSK